MLFRKTISVLLLVLLLGASLFAYLALPNFLASVLKNTFQKGTGCEVSLKHPEIDFLQVTASISEVSIICPNEKDGEGFFASKIIAGIDLSELYNKKALVSPLEISGANVKSLNWDSAFIKTLSFVLQKPEKKKGSWSGWVPEITIKTEAGKSQQLVFGNENLHLTADEVVFTSIDAVDRPETAVIMEARASGVRVVGKDQPPVEVGNLDLVAEAKQGRILFSDTEILLKSEMAVGHTRLSGFIEVKNDELFLDLVSKVDGEIIESLASSRFDTNLIGKFDILTSVRGNFANPSFNFEIIANELNYPTSQSAVPNCIPLSGSAKVEYKDDVVSINKFQINDLVELNDIDFTFNGLSKFSYENSFSLNLDSLSRFLCADSNHEITQKNRQQMLSGYLKFVTDKDSGVTGVFNLEKFDLKDLPIVKNVFKKGRHQATFSGKIFGTMSTPELEGKFNIESVVGKDVAPSILQLHLNNERLKLNGNAFNDENKLDIMYPIKGNSSTKVLLDFKRFPLTYFMEGENDSRFVVDTDVNLESPDSNITKLKGEVVLHSVDLRPEFEEFAPKEPVRFAFEDGDLTIKELAFDYEGLSVRAFGKVEEFDNLNVEVEVKGNIPEVTASILSWESASGAIDGSISIQGKVSDPKVDGRIVLSDGFGAFRVGEGVVGIEDVNSTILFDKSDLTIPSFAGSFGDGELKITGRINSYFDEATRNGNLLISGENLLFEPTAGLAVRLDTDLSLLVFPRSSPLLQGEIIITEAVYQKEITIQNIVAALSRFIIGKSSVSRLNYEEGLVQSDGLNLAIRARTSQGLLVDTSVFKAELDGDLRLSGKLNNPIVEGGVDIIDGDFVINQTKFEVLGGSMKFDGSHNIDPLISLSSEGDLRKRTGDTEKIFLNISGHLGATKVSFSSDGATPPKDIVRQLGIGSGGSQLYLVQSDVKNLGFREVLSPSSDLSLSERFAGLTGFDQVRIETAVSTRTGEFVPQILGSRPFPYDLRSTLWTELSGDRASGARLEYRLRDDISPFIGWRSQSVTQASTTNSSNFSVGIRLKETFKGLLFTGSRVKESD